MEQLKLLNTNDKTCLDYRPNNCIISVAESFSYMMIQYFLNTAVVFYSSYQNDKIQSALVWEGRPLGFRSVLILVQLDPRDFYFFIYRTRGLD